MPRGRASCRGLGQIADADQIVDSSGEHKHPVHATLPRGGGSSASTDCLQPPEDLFPPARAAASRSDIQDAGSCAHRTRCGARARSTRRSA